MKTQRLTVVSVVGSAMALMLFGVSRVSADTDGTRGKQSDITAAAIEAYKATQASFLTNKTTVEDLYRWSKQVMECERADGNAKAVDEHTKRMEELHGRIEKYRQTGSPQGSEINYYSTKFYLLEAKAALTNYNIHNLTGLRKDGAIVIMREQPPKARESLGVEPLRPFSSVVTVELYVTPKGANASIGDSEAVMPVAVAQKHLVEKAAEARSYGAEDIQLGIIGGVDRDWMKFGIDNSMSVIGDSKPRYLAQLKANRESGANINPNQNGDTRESNDENASPDLAQP